MNKKIQNIQDKLLRLAVTKAQVKLIQLSVKAIREITINEMYDNMRKDLFEMKESYEKN